MADGVLEQERGVGPFERALRYGPEDLHCGYRSGTFCLRQCNLQCSCLLEFCSCHSVVFERAFTAMIQNGKREL